MTKTLDFYEIPRKQYAILKRFCTKYHEYKFDYENLNFYGKEAGVRKYRSDDRSISDPTFSKAYRLADLKTKIDIIERSARQASPEYAYYIIQAACEDRSFEHLKYELKMDCSRKIFFELVRKFFWILNKSFLPAQAQQVYIEKKIPA